MTPFVHFLVDGERSCAARIVKLRATLTPPQSPLSALNSLGKIAVRAVAFRVQRRPVRKSRYPSIINAMHSVQDGVMVGRDFTAMNLDRGPSSVVGSEPAVVFRATG